MTVTVTDLFCGDDEFNGAWGPMRIASISDLDREAELNLIRGDASDTPVLAGGLKQDDSHGVGWNADAFEPPGQFPMEPLLGLWGPAREQSDLYEDVRPVPGRRVNEVRWLLGHPDSRIVVRDLKGLDERLVDSSEDPAGLSEVQGPEGRDLGEGHLARVRAWARRHCVRAGRNHVGLDDRVF